MHLSEHRPITQGELTEMIASMEAAEQNGLFEGMFSRQQEAAVPGTCKESLIESINPDMKLTKGFFLKIYGYEISWPGFKELALTVLEDAGCIKARAYYEEIIGAYEQSQDEANKRVAADYVKELDKKQKGCEEQRKQQKDQIMKGLEKMSDGDILKLWQQRKQQSRGVF